MEYIDVSTLSGEALDFWSAKAQGYEAVGKLLAYYDPDSGYPQLDSSQTLRTGGGLPTHWRQFYINDCMCDIAYEHELYMKEHHPDLKISLKPRLMGHTHQCFHPLISYYENGQEIINIMEKERIMIMPNPSSSTYKWLARNLPEDFKHPSYTMMGNHVIEAVLRVFIASKFGEVIEN